MGLHLEEDLAGWIERVYEIMQEDFECKQLYQIDSVKSQVVFECYILTKITSDLINFGKVSNKSFNINLFNYQLLF